MDAKNSFVDTAGKKHALGVNKDSVKNVGGRPAFDPAQTVTVMVKSVASVPLSFLTAVIGVSSV